MSVHGGEDAEDAYLLYIGLFSQKSHIISSSFAERELWPVHVNSPLQGGEEAQDACNLSCRCLSAKEPWIIGLFCGKTCKDKASCLSSTPSSRKLTCTGRRCLCAKEPWSIGLFCGQTCKDKAFCLSSTPSSREFKKCTGRRCLSAKELLIIWLFWGNRPINRRHSVHLRHPVVARYFPEIFESFYTCTRDVGERGGDFIIIFFGAYYRYNV